MAVLWLQMLLILEGAASHTPSDEWRPVAEGDVATLQMATEDALEAQWNRSRIGWCRAVVDHHHDRQQFSYWWDGDRTGLEVEEVILGADRDEDIAPPQLRTAIYLRNEQWIYSPQFRRCSGYGGRATAKLPRELDVHPHHIWLTMLDGQIPKLRHLDRIRAAIAAGDRLRVSRNDARLLRFETRTLRLVVDPQRGFSPVRAEFQTNLEEDSHPELLLPVVEEYDLAQDKHGEWYCRQMTRTSWPRGGNGDSWTLVSPTIVAYDSRPDAELLRLSFKDLDLPTGTNVQSYAPSRKGNWIVGREREGKAALTEQQFRDLGRLLRSRGFAEEREP